MAQGSRRIWGKVVIRTLNRKFTLEALAATPDGAGGQAEVWAPLGEHFVSLTASAGRERNPGGRPSARVTHTCWLRYYDYDDPARPRPDQRFREGTRIYAIRAIAEADDLRRYLVCWLEEGALS